MTCEGEEPFSSSYHETSSLAFLQTRTATTYRRILLHAPRGCDYGYGWDAGEALH
jgi:hypothetical protein